MRGSSSPSANKGHGGPSGTSSSPRSTTTIDSKSIVANNESSCETYIFGAELQKGRGTAAGDLNFKTVRMSGVRRFDHLVVGSSQMCIKPRKMSDDRANPFFHQIVYLTTPFSDLCPGNWPSGDSGKSVRQSQERCKDRPTNLEIPGHDSIRGFAQIG